MSRWRTGGQCREVSRDRAVNVKESRKLLSQSVACYDYRYDNEACILRVFCLQLATGRLPQSRDVQTGTMLHVDLCIRQEPHPKGHQAYISTTFMTILEKSFGLRRNYNGEHGDDNFDLDQQHGLNLGIHPKLGQFG